MAYIIDCGHCLSGYDTGATGLGRKEEVLTREVGKALGEVLEKQGEKVYFTNVDKANSVNESLRERVNKANSIKDAAAFISIHFNSFENSAANGVEVLISGRGGKAEVIAKKVNDNLSKEIGLRNRGVKVNSNLYVLKNTIAPAVLIECLFITNKEDMSKYNPNKIANAICKGLLNKDIGNSEATVEENKKERYFTTFNVDSELTIREKGNIESKALGYIKKGEKFKLKWVDKEYLGWLYINYNGILGYVCAKYTKEIKEEEQEKEKWGIVINVNHSSYLTVREKALIDSKAIGKVFKDEEVKIIWTELGWHYIEYSTSNGYKRGYVNASYIRTFLK